MHLEIPETPSGIKQGSRSSSNKAEDSAGSCDEAQPCSPKKARIYSLRTPSLMSLEWSPDLKPGTELSKNFSNIATMQSPASSYDHVIVSITASICTVDNCNEHLQADVPVILEKRNLKA
jgi:hypothetical protein